MENQRKMEFKLEGEKHISFIQRPKLSKNMQFGADADIYVYAKKVRLWEFWELVM